MLPLNIFWKLLSRSSFQLFSALLFWYFCVSALLFWELCVYWHLLSLCRISVFGDARRVFKPLVFKSYFLLGSRTDSPVAGKCGFRDASLDSNSCDWLGNIFLRRWVTAGSPAASEGYCFISKYTTQMDMFFFERAVVNTTSWIVMLLDQAIDLESPGACSQHRDARYLWQ